MHFLSVTFSLLVVTVVDRKKNLTKLFDIKRYHTCIESYVLSILVVDNNSKTTKNTLITEKW